jgi:hypothetical protein
MGRSRYASHTVGSAAAPDLWVARATPPIRSAPLPLPTCTAPGDSGKNAQVTDRVCENCAMPDEELVMVRRVYVVPPSWDTPGSQTVIAEPELWCISCISQYPCEVVDD